MLDDCTCTQCPFFLNGNVIVKIIQVVNSLTTTLMSVASYSYDTSGNKGIDFYRYLLTQGHVFILAVTKLHLYVLLAVHYFSFLFVAYNLIILGVASVHGGICLEIFGVSALSAT